MNQEVKNRLGGGKASDHAEDEQPQSSLKDKPVADLQRAFPRSRINWSKFRWYHTFWLLYVPVGLVFAAVRFFLLAAYFVIAPTLFPEDCRSLWFWTTWGTTCFYKTRHVYDDAHRDAYGPGDFVYATPHEIRGMLTRGGRRSLADVAKTIFALEHHAWFLDATLFHCLMLRNGLGSTTLVGRGAATDGLVSHLLPREYAMLMGPGEKLKDMLSRWRARKSAGCVEPFVLFPAGTTCAVDAVCEFQPRVVELLLPGERIRPVAVDVISPLPFIELRGLGSTNVADLVWYTFTPWWLVVFTILPELPTELTARPAEAAAYMQRAVAAAGVRPKAAVKANLFDKRAWEKRACARALPGYRATERRWIAALQRRWPARLRWLPALLHYATLEPVLLAVGAAAALLRAGPAGADLLFGTLGRAVALNLVALHVAKLATRVPRPAWVDAKRELVPPGSSGRRRVTSREYALPSGHSGFVACCWAAAAAVAGASAAASARADGGAAAALVGPFGLKALAEAVSTALAGGSGLLGAARVFGISLPAHACFAALAAAAALSRVYLALHWPSDVAGGLTIGAIVGATSAAIIDPWYLALPPLAQARLAAAGAALLCLVCRFVLGAATAVDRTAFEVWSATAGVRVDPLDPSLWLAAAGIAGGVWGAAPFASLLAAAAARAASGAAAAAANATPAVQIAARVAGAGAGAAFIALAAAVVLVLPARALARLADFVGSAAAPPAAGTNGGSDPASKPAAGEHSRPAPSLKLLRQAHLVIGIAAALQAVLFAAAVVAPTAERAALLLAAAAA